MREKDSWQIASPRLSEAGKLLALATAYFVAGKLGTLLALPPGYATPIWAPSGIAVAGILLFGFRFWPAIWLGSVLVNLSTTLHSSTHPSLGQALLISGVIGLGASAQAVAASFLIRRWAGLP